MKTPSAQQPCSFFSNPLLGFCPSTTAFLWSCSMCIFMHLTHWKFQNIASEKDDLLSILQGLAIFTWIRPHKTHDLTDYQLTVGSFPPAITFMWSDRQIRGWPQFFLQQLFLSVPSQFDINCVIIFKVSTLIFCVLIWPRQSLHTACFRIFVALVIWSILEFAVLLPPLAQYSICNMLICSYALVLSIALLRDQQIIERLSIAMTTAWVCNVLCKISWKFVLITSH